MFEAVESQRGRGNQHSIRKHKVALVHPIKYFGAGLLPRFSCINLAKHSNESGFRQATLPYSLSEWVFPYNNCLWQMRL